MMLSKDLFEDIVKEILTMLPVKSIVRFKSVGKSWNTLTIDQSFIAMQIRQSTRISEQRCCKFTSDFQYDGNNVYFYFFDNDLQDGQGPKKVYAPIPDGSGRSYHRCVGHCNGIVCLYGRFNCCLNTDNAERDYIEVDCNRAGDNIALWNPATREFKFLPTMDRTILVDTNIINCFAFDSNANDYKVIRVVAFPTESSFRESLQIEVYALNTNSWRVANVVVPTRHLEEPISRSYVNGTCHWFIRDKYDCGILSYNFEDDILYKTELPSMVHSYSMAKMSAAIVDDCLALYLNENISNVIEIWVMEELGVVESWNKKYDIRLRGPRDINNEFLGIWKGTEILLRSYQDELVWYDILDEEITRDLHIQMTGRLFFYSSDYIKSIVPLWNCRDENNMFCNFCAKVTFKSVLPKIDFY